MFLSVALIFGFVANATRLQPRRCKILPPLKSTVIQHPDTTSLTRSHCLSEQWLSNKLGCFCSRCQKLGSHPCGTNNRERHTELWGEGSLHQSHDFNCDSSGQRNNVWEDVFITVTGLAELPRPTRQKMLIYQTWCKVLSEPKHSPNAYMWPEVQRLSNEHNALDIGFQYTQVI